MDTIYIVSGLPRSGTSMMMRCLAHSGDFVRTWSDKTHYDDGANPNGDYEPLPWPRLEDLPHRALMKLFPPLDDLPAHIGGPTLPVGRHWKFVYIVRDMVERHMSTMGHWKHILPEHNPALRYDERSIEALTEHPDVDFAVVFYPDVVAHPLEHFKFLAERGWPINPEVAASLVDPALYRYRR